MVRWKHRNCTWFKPLTKAAVDSSGRILDYSVMPRSSDEIIHVSAETVEEENRLKEDDRTAVEPTSPPPIPTQPSVPLNPCEG